MRVAYIGSNFEGHAELRRRIRERGHEVLSFDDAREVIEAIHHDCVIDIVGTCAYAKPISGLEVCWEARLLAGEDRALYILFVVPPGEGAIEVEALDCGADETVNVHVRPEEFDAKLRVAERVISLQRDLLREASIDHLSGADNRRAFFRKLAAACSDTSRGASLSVIYLDVDRFKAINDRYGHLSRALEKAADLKRRLARVRIQTPEGIVGITCSLGVSEFQAGDAPDDLMKRADLALYQAKDRGGNRVAATPKNPWMNGRPKLGVSLVRLLPRPSPERRDRRKRQPASDALIARVCAVIDLLIASGLDEEAACEAMAKRLIVADLPLPRDREKTSSWPKHLREQGEFLRNAVPTKEATSEYESVVTAIGAIAPHERVRWVLENDVWDRRRRTASIPGSTWIANAPSKLTSFDTEVTAASSIYRANGVEWLKISQA